MLAAHLPDSDLRESDQSHHQGGGHRGLTRCERHGALTVMDNTFAGFHQHGEFDVDLFVHSLTKYASGTGDVMGGAVIGRPSLSTRAGGFRGARRIARPRRVLIQRGLKTYFVRYRAVRQRNANCAAVGSACRGRASALSRVAEPSPACAGASPDREFGSIVSSISRAGSRQAGGFLRRSSCSH